MRDPFTDGVLERLRVLHRKLEDEGMYVRANTVWLAIEEITRMRTPAPTPEPKPGTLAYAQAVHDDMTDPTPKPGETVEQARARRDYYRGYDDDGLPSD